MPFLAESKAKLQYQGPLPQLGFDNRAVAALWVSIP